jgi:hypothetical protein
MLRRLPEWISCAMKRLHRWLAGANNLSSVLRVAATLGGIALVCLLGQLVVREWNATRVHRFCVGIQAGDERTSIIARAHQLGFEVRESSNTDELSVWKRSWAGVGACTIELRDGLAIKSTFEDS